MGWHWGWSLARVAIGSARSLVAWENGWDMGWHWALLPALTILLAWSIFILSFCIEMFLASAAIHCFSVFCLVACAWADFLWASLWLHACDLLACSCWLNPSETLGWSWRPLVLAWSKYSTSHCVCSRSSFWASFSVSFCLILLTSDFCWATYLWGASLCSNACTLSNRSAFWPSDLTLSEAISSLLCLLWIFMFSVFMLLYCNVS